VVEAAADEHDVAGQQPQRLVRGLQMDLAFDDGVDREPGDTVEREPPATADRRVRERRATGPRALEHVGENVHDTRRWHM
jgi:hypothetical protein